MRKEIITWLAKEFVSLAIEAKHAASTVDETEQIFRSFEEELRPLGLSLDDTVRTRLWGRDRESRDQGSNVRFKRMSGRARSASSSYISPAHFAGDGRIAMDLLALNPSKAGAHKTVKEYEPPIVPPRYVVYDGLIFLSGVTMVFPTLEEQMAQVMPKISGSLADAGTSWNKVVKVSAHLHRSQSPEQLKALFQKSVQVKIPLTEIAFVDGYSSAGKLVEVEVTATT